MILWDSFLGFSKILSCRTKQNISKTLSSNNINNINNINNQILALNQIDSSFSLSNYSCDFDTNQHKFA